MRHSYYHNYLYSVCKDAGMKNVFAEGEHPPMGVEKEYLRRHQTDVAATQLFNSSDADRLPTEQILPLLKNVYWLAMENVTMVLPLCCHGFISLGHA